MRPSPAGHRVERNSHSVRRAADQLGEQLDYVIELVAPLFGAAPRQVGNDGVVRVLVPLSEARNVRKNAVRPLALASPTPAAGIILGPLRPAGVHRRATV